MISKKVTATVLLLLLATWAVLHNGTSVKQVPIKQTLATFPAIIGGYHLIKTSTSSEDVIEMLGVDDSIQYTYSNSAGNTIDLYIGYYSAVGVTGAYHSPKNCLPGGGWGIDDINQHTLEAGIEGNNTSVVSEMLIRNGDQYQMVLYWFQNRGRIIASEYWEKIYLVLDAITKKRRDGTFIRIMAPVNGNDFTAASKVTGNFAEQIMPILETYIPGSSI